MLMRLPEQPVINKHNKNNFSVNELDLVYVNSFKKLVDDCLEDPGNPTRN